MIIYRIYLKKFSLEQKYKAEDIYEILFGKDIDIINNENEFRELIENYDNLIQRNIYKDPFFLCFQEKLCLKSLLKNANQMDDTYPLLKLRKFICLSYR